MDITSHVQRGVAMPADMRQGQVVLCDIRFKRLA